MLSIWTGLKSLNNKKQNKDPVIVLPEKVSLGKTLQSPSLVLVKPRKDMNKVSCRRDMTEILLKAA